MERINLNYSLKNIPTPTKSSYQLKLIQKIERVIKRMKTLVFLREKMKTAKLVIMMSVKTKKRPLALNQNNTQHKLTNCKVLKKID